jgi:hypothetical protein
VDLGPVLERSRIRPDGVTLTWRMTDPSAPREDSILPFLIDWGTTPHPAGTSPRAGELRHLRAIHPEAVRVRERLAKLGLALSVEVGEAPALIATIDTAHGAREIR